MSGERDKVAELMGMHRPDRAAPPAVPEGFRLVPVVPTEAMLKSGNQALSPWVAPAMHADDAYRAMIAATPAVPAPAETRGEMLAGIVNDWAPVLRAVTPPPEPEPLQAQPEGVPSGVWEALQRMIEDGLLRGPASQDDARAVARYHRLMFTAAQEPLQAQGAIYLVCTGEVVGDEETYTRHEGHPPPLCDYEGPLYAAAPLTQRVPLSEGELREIFLAAGFTVKPGETDLKPYVFAAGRAIEAKLLTPTGAKEAQP